MEEKVKRLIEKYKDMAILLRKFDGAVFNAKAETLDFVIKDLVVLLGGDTNDV